jgi:hypothetical protein
MESVRARDSRHWATNLFKPFKPFQPFKPFGGFNRWNLRGIERFEPFGWVHDKLCGAVEALERLELKR